MSKKLVIIYSPKARNCRSNLLSGVKQRLEKLGWHVDMEATPVHDGGVALAQNAVKKKYNIIVAAGGDGTINSVVNGMYGSEIPLAIIPCGTANVLAIELGIHKHNASQLAEMIDKGNVADLPMFKANERNFVMVTSVGFDALSVAAVNKKIKRILGKGAYIWAGLKVAFLRDNRDYEIEIDGTTHCARWVIISRGKHYAGPCVIVPQADILSPCLYVVMMKKSSVFALLGYFLAIMAGRVVQHGGMEVVMGEKVKIENLSEEVPVQVDGDILTVTPLVVSAMEKPLKLIYQKE